MRHRVILLTAWILTACGSTRSESEAVSPTLEPVVEFLLTSAATDFYTHRPPDPVRFRDVRFGHVTAPDGEPQYMLCGQFLPAREERGVEWTPFVIIKTSGYEQWLGTTGHCQGSEVVWDGGGDLSASLLSRLDSLRQGG